MPIEPLLRSVALANRYQRILINTLGFGQAAQRFLEPLAEQNLGTYLQIIGPPKIPQDEGKRDGAVR
jgi:hypothetical protein